MAQWTNLLQTTGLCLASTFVMLKIGPICLALVCLTAVRQMKKLFQKFSKSHNSTPDVSLGFLNRFLALAIRLWPVFRDSIVLRCYFGASFLEAIVFLDNTTVLNDTPFLSFWHQVLNFMEAMFLWFTYVLKCSTSILHLAIAVYTFGIPWSGKFSFDFISL